MYGLFDTIKQVAFISTAWLSKLTVFLVVAVQLSLTTTLTDSFSYYVTVNDNCSSKSLSTVAQHVHTREEL